MNTTATCDYCGKTYTGTRAVSQLRGHHMRCEAWKNAKEKSQMEVNPTPTPTAGEPEPVNPPQNLNPHLTAEERAIVDRVMSDSDTSWFTIKEGDIEDFSLQRDPMELPPPAQQRQDERELAFMWAQLDPRRIDQLTKMAEPPLRWAVCNRITAPWLDGYFNDIYGCVVREDCVLLMKPWHHHEMVKARKAEMNKAYEQNAGIKKVRQRIEARDDIETFTGSKFKIGKGDEVIADEAAFDAPGEGGEDLVA